LAIAQDFPFKHYGPENGFPTSVFYDVKQDEAGYIWLASGLGVVRFDGTSFVRYTRKDGISNDEVLFLFCDSQSRIWIFPFQNQISYHYKDSIYPFDLLGKPEARPVSRIGEDKKGGLWIHNGKRLIRYFNDSIDFELQFVLSKPIADGEFSPINFTKSPNNELYLAGNSGMYHLDVDGEHAKMVFLPMENRQYHCAFINDSTCLSSSGGGLGY